MESNIVYIRDKKNDGIGLFIMTFHVMRMELTLRTTTREITSDLQRVCEVMQYCGGDCSMSWWHHNQGNGVKDVQLVSGGLQGKFQAYLKIKKCISVVPNT
jgi:hypothetical protein